MRDDYKTLIYYTHVVYDKESWVICSEVGIKYWANWIITTIDTIDPKSLIGKNLDIISDIVNTDDKIFTHENVIPILDMLRIITQQFAG